MTESTSFQGNFVTKLSYSSSSATLLGSCPRRPRNAPGSARGWIAVPIVALVTTLLPGVVAASPTQSVGDLQKQAAQVASQLDALNTKSSVLDEQYNETQIKLQHLNDDLAASRQAVAEAKSALDQHRSTAKKYAVDAYMTGGRVDDLVDPGNDNASISRRRIYLSAVNGDRQQVIAQVTNSEQDLHQRETSLKAKSDAISSQKATLEKAKSQLQSTIDQQQSLQSSVKGKLADAVAKEEARRQAAAAAAAAEAAADAGREGRCSRPSRRAGPIHDHDRPQHDHDQGWKGNGARRPRRRSPPATSRSLARCPQVPRVRSPRQGASSASRTTGRCRRRAAGSTARGS